jgi:hypothetical protein
MTPAVPGAPAIPPGTPVEVFSSFVASWVRGFEIADIRASGYQVRRLSDRTVLPTTFGIKDLRVQRS